MGEFWTGPNSYSSSPSVLVFARTPEVRPKFLYRNSQSSLPDKPVSPRQPIIRLGLLTMCLHLFPSGPTNLCINLALVCSDTLKLFFEDIKITAPPTCFLTEQYLYLRRRSIFHSDLKRKKLSPSPIVFQDKVLC